MDGLLPSLPTHFLGRSAWLFAHATLLLLFGVFLSDIRGGDPAQNPLLYSLIISLPIATLFLYACGEAGIRASILFFSGALLFGQAVEMAGMRYGIFGGLYSYGDGFLSVAGVPIVVPLYWFFFLYLGYVLLGTGARAALAVVAIDLAMDPLQVAAGSWTWHENGAYFGVPVGNFIGWFLCSLFFFRILRRFEGDIPQNSMDRHLPQAIYCTLGILFLYVGFRMEIVCSVLPGVAAMAAVVFQNIRMGYTYRYE